MSTIKLLSMDGEYFKGIRSIHIDFSHVTNIYGRNASGKTSLIDLFFWVMFGKDSQGNSDNGGRSGKFQPRPKDENGADEDGVDITGIVTLDVDGDTKVFKKVQSQKWVKKRNSTAPTLEGNTNTFSINGFPVTETEYKAAIAEIISEELFILLTDPVAFARLPWKKQREAISVLAADVTDENVLASDDAYKIIAADILEACADKARAKAVKAMGLLKAEQEKMPVRIDEATRSLVDLGGATKVQLTAEMETLRKDLDAVREEERTHAIDTSEMDALNAQIMDVRGEMDKISTDVTDAVRNALRDARAAYNRLFDESNRLMTARNTAERTVAIAKAEIENLTGQKMDRVEQYKATRAMVLPDGQTKCPMCGREYEADKIEQIKADFEANKQKTLAEITEAGVTLKNRIEEKTKRLAELEAAAESAKDAWTEATGKCGKAFEAMNAVPKDVDLNTVPEYVAAKQRLDALLVRQSELRKALTEASSGNDVYKIRQREILDKIDGVNRMIAAADMNEATRSRIESYKAEQKDLAQRVADQEQIIETIEAFIRQKMEMVSEAVNKCFRYVRFRMFTERINGGIEDTCVMQINSNGSYVDFWSANHAAQIAGGLDVIDTLSRIHGVTCPIFIDNREAITEIPDMKAQIINLYVSPEDTTLRVENN